MIGIVSDPTFMDHNTGSYHPETPIRIQYLHGLFTTRDPDIMMVDPVAASEDDIKLNHQSSYIEQVRRLCDAGSGYLDPDTAYSELSYSTALLAAGSLNRLCEMALKGEIESGFAFVRPPGHHAVFEKAMGFCIFNNVAIAARKALDAFGVKKVLIVDFDVHHGNGTQDSFYRDDKVLYFSSHQYPFYPGTGAIDEIGSGAGEGLTVNCPMSYGKTDTQYMGVYSYVLRPVIKAYQPGLILVSAGFDAHAQDPIGGMRLSSRCYGAIAGLIRDTAKELGIPVVYTLEGGYNLEAQRESVKEVIAVLKGSDAPDIQPETWPELDRMLATHGKAWSF